MGRWGGRETFGVSKGQPKRVRPTLIYPENHDLEQRLVHRQEERLVATDYGDLTVIFLSRVFRRLRPCLAPPRGGQKGKGRRSCRN